MGRGSGGHLPENDGVRWTSFTLLLVGVLLSPLSFFIVNIALPTICLDLALTPEDVQIVVSGYLSAYAVFLITGGRLGDLYGRRPVFLAGVAVFGFSSALCGLASSPATLVAGRILQGVASAIMVPQALGSIHDLFPIDERPFALGVYGAVLGLATVGGQSYGGALVSADLFGLGWRFVFLANIPVVFVTLALGPLLRNTRRFSSERLDFIGVSLMTLTLAFLIVPLIEGRAAGWPLWAFAMFLAAPILAAMFWRHEVRVLDEGGAPLVDPRIACMPGLHWGLFALLTFYATSIFFVSFNAYLQNALGKNPLAAGMAFLPFGVGSFVGPLASPYASKKFGSVSAPLAMLLETIGFLSLAAITWTTPNGVSDSYIACSLFIAGFGQGVALPALMRAILGDVDPSWWGLISGVINSTLQLSGALGVAIIGGVFYATQGQAADAASIGRSFTLSLLCVALSLIASTISTFALTRVQSASGSAKSSIGMTRP